MARVVTISTYDNRARLSIAEKLSQLSKQEPSVLVILSGINVICTIPEECAEIHEKAMAIYGEHTVQMSQGSSRRQAQIPYSKTGCLSGRFIR